MMREIVFGGGCFWGVEEYFSRIEGVKNTKVGYANGHTENPTYEAVCTGNTNHVEACYIQYDTVTISLIELLDKYWAIVDPTLSNQQGADIGTQYKTGIYYIDENDKVMIENSRQKEQSKYSKPIVTDIEPLNNFYDAEEEHQEYLKKNPGGYCHIPGL